MEEKEAGIAVVEINEEYDDDDQRFEEQHACYVDQSTEARLDEIEAAEASEYVNEPNRPSKSTGDVVNTADRKNEDARREKIGSGKSINDPGIPGSSVQIDGRPHPSTQNEPLKNKRISKIQESEGRQRHLRRTSSFIRPTNAPSFKQSLNYAMETMMWNLYHSIVLMIIPVIIVIVIYGSVWFFPINNENMKIYRMITIAFYLTCTYSTITNLAIYMFGKQRVIKLVYKLTAPLCLLNICFVACHIFFEIKLLIFGEYFTLFAFCYLLLKKVSTEIQTEENLNQVSNRFEVLASDGTPMAVLKGLVPFFIIYIISRYFILPFCMESGILIRILSRVAVVPFLFSATDAFMNNLIIQKSVEYLKYRMAFGNLMSLVSLAILRFMISYSPGTYETVVMSLCSGIFEVILWSSYIPRSVYTMKFIGFIKIRITSIICRRKRIKNLEGVVPQSSADNERNNQIYNQEREIVEIENIELSVEGFRRLFSQLNQEDSTTRYVTSHRTNRCTVLYMSEIQFIIILPIILYLCNPVQGYLRFQPTDTFLHLLTSIFIQLPIELSTQIISICLENYLYGIKVHVEKSLKCNLKPLIIIPYSVLSLMVIFLSINTFWIPVEDWSDN